MSDEQNPKFSTSSASTGNAGGVFIAIGGIAGVLLGGILGQPSAGFLAGLALGGIVALLIWLFDRE